MCVRQLHVGVRSRDQQRRKDHLHKRKEDGRGCRRMVGRAARDERDDRRQAAEAGQRIRRPVTQNVNVLVLEVLVARREIIHTHCEKATASDLKQASKRAMRGDGKKKVSKPINIHT